MKTFQPNKTYLYSMKGSLNRWIITTTRTQITYKFTNTTLKKDALFTIRNTHFVKWTEATYYLKEFNNALRKSPRENIVIELNKKETALINAALL